MNSFQKSISGGRRKWVARVDICVHAAFLIVVAVVIVQSQVLADLWGFFGY
jgi:hypothetical protein